MELLRKLLQRTVGALRLVFGTGGGNAPERVEVFEESPGVWRFRSGAVKFGSFANPQDAARVAELFNGMKADYPTTKPEKDKQ